MGDSGTGKSALIRQLLAQLEDRGDTAIGYDPALEYTLQFYAPDRGDAILNPLDARSPHWSPGEELRHDAEALTLATSLFPDRANENPFFTEGPRRIFAHLLTFRPTAEELASWLCQDEELDRRVHGTPYASIIDRQAPAQRSGVLAALNMVADTLKLLPREPETRSVGAPPPGRSESTGRGRGTDRRAPDEGSEARRLASGNAAASPASRGSFR
jgi:GTPase SAR1 family protein